jgi:drug/metabolite transporter (DMT)-like permease
LLAFFILRQKPSRQAVIGVILAVCGLYLLAFRDLNSVNIGDLLALICAFGFGLQIVYTGKYSSRTSVFHLVLIQLAVVAVLSGISAAIYEPGVRPSLLADPSVLLALLITSLFCTTLAFLAQTYFQKTTDPAQVALIYSTEPVFAALADYVWNGTVMGTVTITGFAFILAGMIMAEIPVGKYLRFIRYKTQARDVSD